MANYLEKDKEISDNISNTSLTLNNETLLEIANSIKNINDSLTRALTNSATAEDLAELEKFSKCTVVQKNEKEGSLHV